MTSIQRTSVSVVIATYRKGGAELPLRALAKQSLQGFEIVLATECAGADAWRGLTNGLSFELVTLSPLNFHAPTRALNAGIDKAKGEIVVLLADFAYPDANWLEVLVSTLVKAKGEIAAVGGVKCSHGVASGQYLHTLPCPNPIIPLGIPNGVTLLFPCQQGFTLGNIAAWTADVRCNHGLDDRFAGGHGYEDENFVRRLVALTKSQAIIDSRARVHHYWPYHLGYKPLVKAEHRPWAFGHTNAQLDRFLIDSELCIGDFKAQRHEMHDAPVEHLVERKAAAPPL